LPRAAVQPGTDGRIDADGILDMLPRGTCDALAALMKRTKPVGVVMTLGLVAVVAHADVDKPKADMPKIDARADALLRKMSRDLSKLKSFSVDAEHVTEVITTDDHKMQILGSSNVVVQRPNMLRSDRKSPMGALTFYYDGTNVTIYGKKNSLYATAPAPDTIDRTIDYARDTLDLDAPAADLLYSDPYKVLMEDVVSGMYVDEAVMQGRVCEHLAFRGKETDFEIWIEDGKRALPCRFVITTKDVEGWPQYEVELTNWKIMEHIPSGEFTFHPPSNARKIDFLAVATAKQKMRKRGGAS
jgi:hypothetical protein